MNPNSKTILFVYVRYYKTKEKSFRPGNSSKLNDIKIL